MCIRTSCHKYRCSCGLRKQRRTKYTRLKHYF
uniref:Uncharacterized protein n=1 Tax=Anguilla anguilla TaxID=7936 RepID=A0A0E9XSL9_ANGAN